MSRNYEAIVAGARCAGSPTAMLLDRATFPSDTISTHVVHPLAVASLARRNLLDRLVRTGCPPIHTYAFDFGSFALSGSPGLEFFAPDHVHAMLAGSRPGAGEARADA
jgi:hypothetical protein